MEELWKDIPEYEGWYQVSNLGNVRSLDRNIIDGRKIKGTMLCQHIDEQGYKRIALCKEGKHKKFQVHRLVAKAFVENPNNFPVINHIDENPSNNNANNLEWCTVQYNVNYGNRAKKYGVQTCGEKNYHHKLTNQQVIAIRNEYQQGVYGHGQQALSKKYGIDRMTIKAILIGHTWKHLLKEDYYNVT